MGSLRPANMACDDVLCDCKLCVDKYVDDCIVYFCDMETHTCDLQIVLGKLKKLLVLTLQQSKCCLAKVQLHT